jgi:hypothetical protein
MTRPEALARVVGRPEPSRETRRSAASLFTVNLAFSPETDTNGNPVHKATATGLCRGPGAVEGSIEARLTRPVSRIHLAGPAQASTFARLGRYTHGGERDWTDPA